MINPSEAKGNKKYFDQSLYHLIISAFELISASIISWWTKPGLFSLISNWWNPSPVVNNKTIADEAAVSVDASRIAKIEELTKNNQAKVIQAAFRTMQAQKEAKIIVDEPEFSTINTKESYGVGRQFLAAATLGGSELARYAPRVGLLSMFVNGLSFGGLSLLQQLTDSLTPASEKVVAKPLGPK